MILLTGFEAFGGDAHNPSQHIAEYFAGQMLGNTQVISRILPVSGADIQAALEKAVEETQPQAIVMLGLARGKTRIALEQVAVNWLEYRIADNTGVQKSGQRIIDAASDALFSSLPMENLQLALQGAGIPFETSMSAGTFLCNQVAFLARVLFPDIPSGFVHLPSDEHLVHKGAEPFLPLEYQIESVRVILEAVRLSL